ncbi:MAG: nucleotidyltransferase family protein [Candidatus Brocadiaceae bacterium]|nr:nucleotidyltransferase family protein [Candidatus Brocadiaceae bacterium]
MKTVKEIQEILKTHKEELRKKYAVKEIGIFGSYVKGQQRRKSDIDILVEFEEIPDLLKFIELERYLQRFLGHKVDLVRKQALRAELKDAILRETVVI